VKSFNLPGWEAPGASDSVWKAQFEMGQGDHPFRSLYGPVLRMIVDLADINHARWVVDTGSSGWPHSPHYGDQSRLWRRVESAPMISDWDEIRKSAVGVLTCIRRGGDRSGRLGVLVTSDGLCIGLP
jgi:acyl-homoserine lactone acylase PvdQ